MKKEIKTGDAEIDELSITHILMFPTSCDYYHHHKDLFVDVL